MQLSPGKAKNSHAVLSKCNRKIRARCPTGSRSMRRAIGLSQSAPAHGQTRIPVRSAVDQCLATGEPHDIACGRGERIRTSGLYVPNVALYQAKLHPVKGHGMRAVRFCQRQRPKASGALSTSGLVAVAALSVVYQLFVRGLCPAGGRKVLIIASCLTGGRTPIYGPSIS